MQFEYDNTRYEYTPYNELLEQNLPLSHEYRESGFLNVVGAFDIETTRINDTMSTMYVWQYDLFDGIKHFTILGRTWAQFTQLIARLEKFYCVVNENGRQIKLLTWIQNASFEWQFLRKHLNFNVTKYDKKEVFALDKREVIKWVTSGGIEFRDSYILTRTSLENYKKFYGLKIGKLSEKDANGNNIFNYDIPRNSLTPLTPLELAYCINDVQTLTEWHYTYIRKFFMHNDIKIPLTQTGIGRDEMKRKFKALPKKEREQWQRKIKNAFPSEKLYKSLMEWVFRGGLTHSDAYYVNDTLQNLDMASYDLKSSYPATILHELFPYRFVRRSPEWFYRWGDDKQKLKTMAYFGTFKFANIRAKTTHSIESKNKIYKYKNAVFDNGRLVKADFLTVCLTEQDFLTYMDFYEWDSMLCLNLHIADKEPLPKYFIDMVLEKFMKKETLRGQQIEYNLAKSVLNAFYGITVTSLFNTNYILDDYNNLILGEDNINYKTLIRKQVLLPQWGVWVCAYSRRNLARTIYAIDKPENGTPSVIYYDTDSIKLINASKYAYVFENYNAKMERINNNMYTADYDKNLFRHLGKFEYENKYYRFKCLGAKRYLTSQVEFNKTKQKYELTTHTTVAGCVKGSFEKYCNNNNLDYYATFDNGLELDENDSKKLCADYNDDGFINVPVVDYLGNVAYHSEKSCLTLNKTTFSMSLKDDYLTLLLKLYNKQIRRIGKRK